MKRILPICALVILTSPIFSQVEMSKTKNTKSKERTLTYIDKQLYLDKFSLNLNLYGYGEDQGGGMGSSSTATVGVRVHLSEVDEALAKEIVDEAYAYFKKQWSNRGVQVIVLNMEQLEATQKYAKAKKKGKNVEVITGGARENREKKLHNIDAWPEGARIIKTGSGPLIMIGNELNMVMDIFKTYPNEGFTGFTSTVNFISFKTAKLGTTARVKPIPQLQSHSGMNVSKYKKGKGGTYVGSNEAKGIVDFYSEVKQEGIDVLATSSNDWTYIADKTKYKANVLEMIKKSMDDIFADFDAVLANI
ncbi:MAG: hypothetical protein ABJG41_02915 [Cyclobacteriaceae bacterium]